MQRAYYFNQVSLFCNQKPDEILGEIARNNQFELKQEQRNAWVYEISLLQDILVQFPYGYIALEYNIPRIGARIDCVFIYKGVIYIIEFKIGKDNYPRDAVDQVMDYALDLKYFHQESLTRRIMPILVCTEAPSVADAVLPDEDGVYKPIRCNKKMLKPVLENLTAMLSDVPINFITWSESLYMPTPTIVEAAQALYRGHDVKEITRRESEEYNLGLTSNTVNIIINMSKTKHEKSICFITGVPGAGKTLVGLNLANERHNFDENEHAVFLSGNDPLVDVLREALARDKYERSDPKIRKSIAEREVESFIQKIRHFRNEGRMTTKALSNKVAIFDEAQRAWTQEKTARFMAERGDLEWKQSEPEFLINVMNRHTDWAVIVCLVGGGQEINTGEAGLPEWFEALRNHFSYWKVYFPRQLLDDDYTRGIPLNEMLHGLNVNMMDNLHLAVSVRSFRSERVSAFVKALLDMDVSRAQLLYNELQLKYPVLLTRNLDTARRWVRSKARGTERYGITASSGAKRLKIFGVWVQSEITPENWFLNDKDDVRSSYFLEDTATEFDIQGLEIDWTIVSWDADYRIEDGHFVPYSFTGTRWNRVISEDNRLYLKNAYRVLLTRARQGMVLFIPHGDDNDITRRQVYYDNTYEYLKTIGIKEI